MMVPNLEHRNENHGYCVLYLYTFRELLELINGIKGTIDLVGSLAFHPVGLFLSLTVYKKDLLSESVCVSILSCSHFPSD